jgi:hypothetical protein
MLSPPSDFRNSSMSRPLTRPAFPPPDGDPKPPPPPPAPSPAAGPSVGKDASKAAKSIGVAPVPPPAPEASVSVPTAVPKSAAKSAGVVALANGGAEVVVEEEEGGKVTDAGVLVANAEVGTGVEPVAKGAFWDGVLLLLPPLLLLLLLLSAPVEAGVNIEGGVGMLRKVRKSGAESSTDVEGIVSPLDVVIVGCDGSLPAGWERSVEKRSGSRSSTLSAVREACCADERVNWSRLGGAGSGLRVGETRSMTAEDCLGGESMVRSTIDGSFSSPPFSSIETSSFGSGSRTGKGGRPVARRASRCKTACASIWIRSCFQLK